MSAIPAMVQNHKHLSVLKNAGAVGKDNAKTLHELGMEENIVLKRLLKLNAIASCDGKYYITDEYTHTTQYKNL